MAMTEPAVVVQKAYDWTLWVIPKVEKYRAATGIRWGKAWCRPRAITGWEDPLRETKSRWTFHGSRSRAGCRHSDAIES
jgi:hypothetical protein